MFCSTLIKFHDGNVWKNLLVFNMKPLPFGKQRWILKSRWVSSWKLSFSRSMFGYQMVVSMLLSTCWICFGYSHPQRPRISRSKLLLCDWLRMWTNLGWQWHGMSWWLQPSEARWTQNNHSKCWVENYINVLFYRSGTTSLDLRKPPRKISVECCRWGCWWHSFRHRRPVHRGNGSWLHCSMRCHGKAHREDRR